VCRHLAWFGRPRSLQDLVVAPRHGLYEQSWAPRRQQHGTVNVDGFGAGWYVDERPEPVRYRRAQPIWTDASFGSLAPVVRSGCVVAAVRSATPGTSPDESAAAPFTHGPWLFSHNGRLHDWAAARAGLRDQLLDLTDVPDAWTAVDSALLFGLAVHAWRSGAPLAEGLVEAAHRIERYGGGRVTLLASDGRSVAGVVAAGEPMHVAEAEDGVLIASEPHADAGHPPAWRELADGAVVLVNDDGVREEKL